MEDKEDYYCPECDDWYTNDTDVAHLLNLKICSFCYEEAREKDFEDTKIA